MAKFEHSLGFDIKSEGALVDPWKYKETGFVAGHKLSAPHFNWIINKTEKALDELQECFNIMVGGKFVNGTAVPVKSGGTGATTTGNARKNLSVNKCTFIGLDQLGITVGTETIEEIVDKLPASSELVCSIGASNNKSIYPSSYGVLRVVKIDNTRTHFHFYLKGNNVHYFGNYDSALGDNAWKGWVTEYNSGNLPIPEYRHRTHELTNENLNDVKTVGYYVAAGNNTCTNTPTTTGTAFGLEVLLSAGTHYTQVLYTQYTSYVRVFNGGNWNAWRKQYDSNNKPTPAEIGAVASETVLPDEADLNKVTTSGAYRLEKKPVNTPEGVYCEHAQLQVVHGGNDTIAQMLFPHETSTMYLRTGNPLVTGGKWNAWVKMADSEHTHTPDDIDGIMPIAKGGTNASDVPTARTNLGFVQGYYTGNGSSDMRTFNIGGIGYALLIWSSTNTMKAIITPEGGTAWFDDGSEATLTEDNSGRKCYFKDGILYLQVANMVLGTNFCNLMNKSGAAYYYQVL